MSSGGERIPVERLKGVGPRLAERLANLGVTSVQDLLFHLPSRYQDRTRLTPIGALIPGGEALVEGTVSAAELGFGRRRSLKVWLAQGETNGLMLRFFYFSTAQRTALKPGAQLRCYGEVRQGPQSLEMVHPEYQILGADVVRSGFLALCSSLSARKHHNSNGFPGPVGQGNGAADHLIGVPRINPETGGALDGLVEFGGCGPGCELARFRERVALFLVNQLLGGDEFLSHVVSFWGPNEELVPSPSGPTLAAQVPAIGEPFRAGSRKRVGRPKLPLALGEPQHRRRPIHTQSVTAIPIDLAVPSMVRIAAVTSKAFMSLSLVSAIVRTCSRVIEPALILFG